MIFWLILKKSTTNIYKLDKINQNIEKNKIKHLYKLEKIKNRECKNGLMGADGVVCFAKK